MRLGKLMLNILGKIIFGCLQIDCRDGMPSIEALAMAGADHNVVQVPFIDRPWIWMLEKICKRLWPFRMKNNTADDESESESELF